MDNPQTEMEMDLAKEDRNDWSLSSMDWLGNKKLFWPLFWEYPDSSEDGTGRMSLEEAEDYALEYDSEETVLSGVGDWDSQWNKGWDSKDTYGERLSFVTVILCMLL